MNDKPVVTYADLMRESHEIEHRKFVAGEYREHRRLGCPALVRRDGTSRACYFHGPWGSQEPMRGDPDPGFDYTETPEPAKPARGWWRRLRRTPA